MTSTLHNAYTKNFDFIVDKLDEFLNLPGHFTPDKFEYMATFIIIELMPIIKVEPKHDEFFCHLYKDTLELVLLFTAFRCLTTQENRDRLTAAVAKHKHKTPA